MSPEEAEELAGTVNGYAEAGAYVVLTCAEDVFGELNETSVRADAEVQVVPHYESGQWKLTLHDACDVVGGETIDQAVIVSHANCTVIGRNNG